MNLRNRLRLLILVTLLPAALFGAAGTYLLFQREQDAFQRAAMGRVDAVVSHFDAQVASTFSALEVLQGSPALTSGDLESFRAEAQRVLDGRAGAWTNIVVSSPQGEMLLNLRIAPGRPLLRHGDPESVTEVVRLRRPVLSNVATNALLPGGGVAMRVPVQRGDEVRYVLSAIVDRAQFKRLLAQHPLTGGSAVALVDRKFQFVARAPEMEGFAVASDSLREALSSQPSGWLSGQLVNGHPVFRAFAHSPLTGWAVSLAIPRATVLQGLQGVWLFAGGMLVALAIGLWFSWRLASRIASPVLGLAQAAHEVAAGNADALDSRHLETAELQQLGDALRSAATEVHLREQQQLAAEQALRAADRSKDEFLAMLGHELRNPLAAVSNAANLLDRGNPSPEQTRRIASVLVRQTGVMRRLVDDLLDAARVAAGKIQLQPARLDLGSLLAEMLLGWREQGRFARHEVEWTLTPGLQVEADAARLQQVFANLLDNAIKFTPAGGRIEVALAAQQGQALLTVSDCGEGMPPELVERVFELFVQGEQGLGRERGGLGIGLTLARRLVELHGGAIEARSAGPGQGSVFAVRLPLAAQQSPSGPGAAPAAADQPLRVLLIDDNRDVLEMLAQVLVLEGHSVETATHGATGIVLATGENTPDIVFVDLGMPGMDGFEVARALRRHPRTAGIGLVALTGYGGPDAEQQVREAGFDAHLVKPASLERLQEAIRRARTHRSEDAVA